MPLQFRAETNLLVYQRQHDLMVSNIKENIVRTKADVTGSISDEQTIGMAFAMDNTFYSDGRFENHTDVDSIHTISFRMTTGKYVSAHTSTWLSVSARSSAPLPT